MNKTPIIEKTSPQKEAEKKPNAPKVIKFGPGVKVRENWFGGQTHEVKSIVGGFARLSNGHLVHLSKLVLAK